MKQEEAACTLREEEKEEEEEEEVWGGLSQLFGAPGFGRCDGKTVQSCFRWSLMSSSSVYSDGSSPGFSNLPT